MRFSAAASGTSFSRPQILTTASLRANECPKSYPLTDGSISSISFPALRDRRADEVDDRLRRRARREDLCDAQLLELGDVLGWDRPADRHDHVVDSLCPQELHDPRDERHVRA